MSREFERIRDFLQSENIEFFSALKVEKLHVINERKMPESAKSAVVFLIPYYFGDEEKRNVSLYAVSRDYHLFVKELDERFCGDGRHFYRFFADSSPIDERQAALDSGLGVKGQNRLLINEKYGSYVFIASIITDALFDENEYVKEVSEKRCLGCGACLEKCAFLGGKRDYCISELNQRKKVTGEELEVIRDFSLCWGCDDCQSVCPHNKGVQTTPIDFFKRDGISYLTSEIISEMSEQTFSQRAYSWRGRSVILRNLGENAEKTDD